MGSETTSEAIPSLSQIKLADLFADLEAACNHYFTYLGVLDLAQVKEIAAGFVQSSPGAATLEDANLRLPGFPLDRLCLFLRSSLSHTTRIET